MIALMVLAALLIYFAIAWLVVKRLKTKKAKWIAIAVFVLIPMWDEILSSIFFQRFCIEEGGAKIYRSIELGKEFFNADGSPKFINEHGYRNQSILEPYFDFRRNSQKIELGFTTIEKDIETIVDKKTGEILGSRTIFRKFGGWVVRSTRGLVFDRAESCGLSPGDDKRLLTTIFVSTEVRN